MIVVLLRGSGTTAGAHGCHRNSATPKRIRIPITSKAIREVLVPLVSSYVWTSLTSYIEASFARGLCTKTRPCARGAYAKPPVGSENYKKRGRQRPLSQSASTPVPFSGSKYSFARHCQSK